MAHPNQGGLQTHRRVRAEGNAVRGKLAMGLLGGISPLSRRPAAETPGKEAESQDHSAGPFQGNVWSMECFKRVDASKSSLGMRSHRTDVPPRAWSSGVLATDQRRGQCGREGCTESIC